MTSERERMLAGALYDPQDPELVAARVRARDLCRAERSVVTKDLPEGMIAVGNPCRVVRPVDA